MAYGFQKKRNETPPTPMNPNPATGSGRGVQSFDGRANLGTTGSVTPPDTRPTEATLILYQGQDKAGG